MPKFFNSIFNTEETIKIRNKDYIRQKSETNNCLCKILNWCLLDKHNLIIKTTFRKFKLKTTLDYLQTQKISAEEQKNINLKIKKRIEYSSELNSQELKVENINLFHKLDPKVTQQLKIFNVNVQYALDKDIPFLDKRTFYLLQAIDVPIEKSYMLLWRKYIKRMQKLKI